MNATETWWDLVSTILEFGHEIRQSDREIEPRDRTTKELLSRTTVWSIANPIVRCANRKLGYRYLTAEAAFIASGDNRVATLAPYSKHVTTFSDDGFTFAGAYGPPFVEQVSYVAREIAKDRNTRQAVMTIWRQRPGSGADKPCTLALQFLVRNDRLHCFTTMRSSDAWLGVVYDVATFATLTHYVALLLKKYHGVEVGLGDLYLTAASQHLYARDWEAANRCIDERKLIDTSITPIDLTEFEDPGDLVDHLWSITRRDGLSDRSWLRELLA